jgi:hypothetical protein
MYETVYGATDSKWIEEQFEAEAGFNFDAQSHQLSFTLLSQEEIETIWQDCSSTNHAASV